jgi:hypothetical protein
VVALLRYSSRTRQQKALILVGASVAAMALTIALYAPFGLQSMLDTVARLRYRDNYVGTSLSSLVVYMLMDFGGMSRSAALALPADLTKLVVLGFLATRCVKLARLQYAERAELVQAFLRASYEVLFVFLLVGVLWLWPWYITWLFAFAPFLGRRAAEHTLVFSLAILVGAYWLLYFGGAFLRSVLHIPRVIPQLVYVCLILAAALLLPALHWVQGRQTRVVAGTHLLA